MSFLSSLLLCGCVLLVDGPVYSQDDPDIDCDNAQTQQDMNYCADKDYQAADAELNAQWKLTKQALAKWDSDLTDDLKGAEKALLASQRAWISYRDAQCELEGFSMRGGTAEPLMVSSCLETLTKQRTEELKRLAADMGN